MTTISSHPKESVDPSPVFATWCPPDGPQPIIIRWLVTEWCNYRCPYCPQTHDRFAEKGDYTAHAFDNHPLDRWIEAFDRHFARNRLSMVITGGEPMLDIRNMPVLLAHLTRQDYVACIRIDTNASWIPEKYSAADKTKIILMCTFHPSQITEEAFLKGVDRIQDAGFRIGMVNYVMEQANVPLFRQRRKAFLDRGLILHPNPLWGASGGYAPEDLELMKASLPDIDFQYRSGRASPFGKPCLFPSISYEMRYTGAIKAGCMVDAGNFFADSLPARPAAWSPCPLKGCACLDKYSFQQGSGRNTSLNPLSDYSRELRLIAQEGGEVS